MSRFVTAVVTSFPQRSTIGLCKSTTYTTRKVSLLNTLLFGDQVGPAGFGPGLALSPTPLRDLGVMARKQDLGDALAPPDGGSGKDRVFEASGDELGGRFEGIPLDARAFPDDARDEPGNRVDQDRRGRLA